MFRVEIFYIAHTRLITLAPGVTRELNGYNRKKNQTYLDKTCFEFHNKQIFESS